MIAELRNAGADERDVETAVLRTVQEIHWTIHRGFSAYQNAAEDRRQLAVDVGELNARLVEILTTSGWTEAQARNANVHQIAGREGPGS